MLFLGVYQPRVWYLRSGNGAISHHTGAMLRRVYPNQSGREGYARLESETMNKQNLSAVSDASEAELYDMHSQAMQTLELVWREAAKRCRKEYKKTEDDKWLRAASEAQAFFRRSQAFHSECDVWAIDYLERGPAQEVDADGEIVAFGGGGGGR